VAIVTERPLGLHHAGVTVRSLDRSLAWWRQMFGVEPTMHVHNEAPLPEATSQALGVPGASLSYAFLPIGDGIVELIEYHQPVGGAYELRNNDIGAMHVGIRVVDIQAQYEHMVSSGAVFRHPPIRLEGERKGVSFAYATDPDGIQVELWEGPDQDGAGGALP
jgi:catechol 2,3-dioxygenase-like lactoylglutathione lyase family enzyme